MKVLRWIKDQVSRRDYATVVAERLGPPAQELRRGYTNYDRYNEDYWLRQSSESWGKWGDQ
jgi:hypothetical protein